MGHARRAASSQSLCGAAAATYRTGLFVAGFVCVFVHIFDFLDSTNNCSWEICKNWLAWRFWDQLQPIGQFFFRAALFCHIFDFLDFKSCFIRKNCKQLICLTFLGPAATYRTVLFSCGFVFYIFSTFWISKPVIYETTITNSFVWRFWDQL